MRHVELPFASRSQQHHSRTGLLFGFQLSLISLARRQRPGASATDRDARCDQERQERFTSTSAFAPSNP
jgi:hypothetical protein